MVYADESINFTDLEIEVLRGILEGKTYPDIVNNTKRSCKGKVCNSIRECRCKYDEDYIRGDIGSRLLRKVSAIMGVKVDKRNCIKVFETRQQDVRLVMSNSTLILAGEQRKYNPGAKNKIISLKRIK